MDLATGGGRDAPTADDVDRAYRERILSKKLEMDAAYLRSRSTSVAVAIILRTIGLALGRQSSS